MGVSSHGVNLVSQGGVGSEFLQVVVFHLYFIAIDGLQIDSGMFL
jgi:hypothetical protein